VAIPGKQRFGVDIVIQFSAVLHGDGGEAEAIQAFLQVRVREVDPVFLVLAKLLV